MGLFTRRRPVPLALTPEAVSAVLAGAGLKAAEHLPGDGPGAAEHYGHRPAEEGFAAYWLAGWPQDRVSVFWRADHTYCGWRGAEAEGLVACATVLKAAGYQTGIVAESASECLSEYLVARVEGEF